MQYKNEKIICICSSFGCGRLQSGGNAENLDDTSRVVKHTPLSSDPANLPIPTPSTNPAKSPALKPQSSNAPASDKSDLNPADEFCGSEKNADLYCLHALSSAFANAVFLLISGLCSSHCASMFFMMLKMVSAFSFPVHAYLTIPSFLSKAKLSLAALAADTCLSLYGLVTKNPLTIMRICNIQGLLGILELFRFLAYPNAFGYLLS